MYNEHKKESLFHRFWMEKSKPSMDLLFHPLGRQRESTERRAKRKTLSPVSPPSYHPQNDQIILCL